MQECYVCKDGSDKKEILTIDMQDDLIFLLCLNILGLFILSLFSEHLFAVEAAWSVINTMLTMYYYYKHRN